MCRKLRNRTAAPIRHWRAAHPAPLVLALGLFAGPAPAPAEDFPGLLPAPRAEADAIAVPDDLRLPPAPCHSYTGQMTLTGTIVRRTWRTPDPMSDGNRIVSGQVLKLPGPICIYPDRDPDFPQSAIIGVTEVTVTGLEGAVGDRVTVTGSPYHSHTAHHMTRLLLDGGVTARPPDAPRQEPSVEVTPIPYRLPFPDADAARLFPQLVLSDPPVCTTSATAGTTCFAGDSENVIALRTVASRDGIAMRCTLTLNSASLEAGIRGCAQVAAATGVAPDVLLRCAREGSLSRPGEKARIGCRWSTDARTALLDLTIRQ